MAIADTDPKKGEADTSTGGAKEGPGGSSSLTPTTASSPSNQTPHSTLYYNIRRFRFSMPEGWDQQSIATFLDCCKQHKQESGSKLVFPNRLWAKIAKAGAQRTGDTNNCFSVNSCIELAQCLKTYIIRNEKLENNKEFRTLYNDVVDLLPYFPASPQDKVVRSYRSPESSTTASEVIQEACVSSQESAYPSPGPSSTSHSLKFTKNRRKFLNKSRSFTETFESISHKDQNFSEMKTEMPNYFEGKKRQAIKDLERFHTVKEKKERLRVVAREYLDIFDSVPPTEVTLRSLVGSNILSQQEESYSSHEEDVGVMEESCRVLQNADLEQDIEEIEQTDSAAEEIEEVVVPKKRGRPRKTFRRAKERSKRTYPGSKGGPSHDKFQASFLSSLPSLPSPRLTRAASAADPSMKHYCCLPERKAPKRKRQSQEPPEEEARVNRGPDKGEVEPPPEVPDTTPSSREVLLPTASSSAMANGSGPHCPDSPRPSQPDLLFRTQAILDSLREGRLTHDEATRQMSDLLIRNSTPAYCSPRGSSPDPGVSSSLQTAGFDHVGEFGASSHPRVPSPPSLVPAPSYIEPSASSIVPSAPPTLLPSTSSSHLQPNHNALELYSHAAPAPYLSSQPPHWFQSFVGDYKRHEVWKIQKLMSVQQSFKELERVKVEALVRIADRLQAGALP